MKGTKLKDMQNTKSQSIVKALVDLFKNYYPCIIHKIFIMNTPMFFDDLWIDLNDAVGEDSSDYGNFIISSNNTHPELKELVDEDNLPSVYGGNSRFDLSQGLFNELGPWSFDTKLILIGEEENKFDDDDPGSDDMDEGIGSFGMDLRQAIQNIPSLPSGPMIKQNTKIDKYGDIQSVFNMGMLEDLNKTPNATPMNTWVDEDN